MQPAAKLLVQRGINPALAFHARQTVKLRRHDAHIEMAFAARPVAGMTLMKSALVRNRQLFGREGGGQFALDIFRDRHFPATSLGPMTTSGKPAMSSNSFACFLTARPHNSNMTGKPRPRFKSDIRIKKGADRPRRSRIRRLAPSPAAPGRAIAVYPSRAKTSRNIFLSARAMRGLSTRPGISFRAWAMATSPSSGKRRCSGHRPTWPMGKRAARPRTGQGPMHFHDRHAVFDEECEDGGPRRPERQLTRLQIITRWTRCNWPITPP